MQLAGKTARTVEALHVLVLILFSAFVPFCFKDAVPDEALANLDAALAEDNSTLVLRAVPEAPALPAGELVLPPVYEVDGFAGSTARGGSHDMKTAGSAGRQGEARCEGDDQARLTMLPFLIALIGGGVFSLEAFEAFPML
mmetsp:Transcript_9118/g.26182  ORF Transcript_9118/g.26182 Transcript_9118/m.26182 type:complete len:141 (-) Transcript_9118:67-489(-)